MATNIQLTLNGLGTFKPEANNFFDIPIGSGSPIHFTQTEKMDAQKNPRQRQAPVRALRGYVGYRTKFGTY